MARMPAMARSLRAQPSSLAAAALLRSLRAKTRNSARAQGAMPQPGHCRQHPGWRRLSSCCRVLWSAPTHKGRTATRCSGTWQDGCPNDRC
eukprot:6200793-Pleurochrysis_carterae.AAC.2